jgi:hypothetical protein
MPNREFDKIINWAKQKEMLRDQVKQNGNKEGDLWPDRKGK